MRERLTRSFCIFYWTFFFQVGYFCTLNSEDTQAAESVLWSKCYTDGVHPNTDSTNSFRNLSFPIKDSCLTVVDAYQCGINECSHGMCDMPSNQDMELWLFIYQLEV